jgi:hypothetical protein
VLNCWGSELPFLFVEANYKRPSRQNAKTFIRCEKFNYFSIASCLSFLHGKLIGWSRVGARVGTQFALFSIPIVLFSPIYRYGNGTIDFVVLYILLVKLYLLLLVVRKRTGTYLFSSTAAVRREIMPFWRLHSVTSRTVQITFVFSFIMACWFKLG